MSSVTPLIRPIRTEGGTFYTFKSSLEDLSLSLNSDVNKKFKFSKFVLLRLPDIKTPLDKENYIQLDVIPGGFNIDYSKTLNTYYAESFQNYCLNLESHLTNLDTYDSSLLRTVSERVFFKWLKEMGCLRFELSTFSEATDPTNLFIESKDVDYNSLVKYIGYTNITNSVKSDYGAYTELYIHVPTNHGATPYILFKSIEDNNYHSNMVITNNPSDPLDKPFILGRKSTDVHPVGLSLKAIYDSQLSSFKTNQPTGHSSLGDFYYYDASSSTWIQNGNPGFKWWFNVPIAYSYYTDIVFGDVTNDRFRIFDGIKDVKFYRSRLDGISIDFNEDDYKDIHHNPNIKNFDDLNSSSLSKGDFEFNAVLVYYNIEDTITNQSVDNLFGVLFLDDVVNLNGGGGGIKPFLKVQSNSAFDKFGNSYSLKLNLKFDIDNSNKIEVTSINEYNTFSLELFVDALNKLKESSNVLLDNNTKVNQIINDLDILKGNIINFGGDLEFLKSEVDNLNSILNSSLGLLDDNSNIFNLINSLKNDINDIINNKTSVSVSYNLDVLDYGYGVFLDKTLPNKVKILNTKEGFNISNKPLIDISSDFSSSIPNMYFYELSLVEYSNYVKIVNNSSSGNPFISDRDIFIYVKDYPVKWEKGKIVRISFKDGLNMSNVNGNFNLFIYTDYDDLLNTGFNYSALVGVVGYDDFTKHDYKPIIEIVCLDDKKFKFEIDVF